MEFIKIHSREREREKRSEESGTNEGFYGTERDRIEEARGSDPDEGEMRRD